MKTNEEYHNEIDKLYDDLENKWKKVAEIESKMNTLSRKQGEYKDGSVMFNKIKEAMNKMMPTLENAGRNLNFARMKVERLRAHIDVELRRN
jgi:archaellum component FlaC